MKKEIDETTGTETTGHVWDDDLRELNTPLPRWWINTLYVSIIWSIGYWILFPAWPLLNGYTHGVLGFSQRAEVARQIEAAKEAQGEMRKLLEDTELAQVASNPELLRFAMAGGRTVFGENCAPCHGRGAQGFPGYPNLNDDDWIWGGKIEDIEATIKYGIRSNHDDTHESEMPRFGVDGLLEKAQLSDVTEYVLSLSGGGGDGAAATRGGEIFKAQCVACHGEDGTGNQALGAPNLADAVSLYGSSRDEIMESVRTGRGGKMPAWSGRLDSMTIKALTVYVHGLGGGR